MFENISEKFGGKSEKIIEAETSNEVKDALEELEDTDIREDIKGRMIEDLKRVRTKSFSVEDTGDTYVLHKTFDEHHGEGGYKGEKTNKSEFKKDTPEGFYGGDSEESDKEE